MSQKGSRKTAISEDKEKRQTASPVKEMKKKMAANAEKEKQAAEKAEKPTEKAAEKQAEKNTDKQTEKSDKNVTDKKSEKNVDKQTEKTDKNVTVDKKSEKADKPAEKSDKTAAADKKTEKNVEKKEPQPENSKEDVNKEEKSGKSEKSDQKKAEKVKQNGREPRVHNGVSDVTLSANGAADDVLNGTVSAESEDDDVMLVIDDQDQDELFPELTYDDGSDVECFEPPTPENAPSRSFTRRSQVKSTRTPETPRPASDKHAEKDTEDPKDSKILKLKEDAPPTDRKLRSADSPKPEAKKDAKKQDKESPKKAQEEKEDGKTQDKTEAEKSDKRDKVDMEVVIEVENEAEEGRSSGKADTNYSKSRVKVSPYRRSRAATAATAADHTNTSLLANYTGNNTTMEMDITETSSFIAEEAASLDDSAYLRGLRSIRGRSSYKPLKELALRHVAARPARSASALNESQGRPTGTVVGRKRKPDADVDRDLAPAPGPGLELGPGLGAGRGLGAGLGPGLAPDACSLDAHAHGKRMRLLDRLAVPFRRTTSARNAEIVGINTDLPLTAPLVSAENFDPETLKTAVPAPEAPIAVPLPTPEERENKRCTVM